MDDIERGRLALEALHEFYAIRNVGEFVYEIRESELQGWNGPKVTAWAAADEKARRALKGE